MLGYKNARGGRASGTYLAGVNALGRSDRGKDDLNTEEKERLCFHVVLRLVQLSFDGFVVTNSRKAKILTCFHWETYPHPGKPFIRSQVKALWCAIRNIKVIMQHSKVHITTSLL